MQPPPLQAQSILDQPTTPSLPHAEHAGPGDHHVRGGQVVVSCIGEWVYCIAGVLLHVQCIFYQISGYRCIIQIESLAVIKTA